MHLDSFILSAVLLLAVTSIAVALFRHLGLGSMLGLLVAGIVVGPHSPGPSVTAHVEDVQNFAELGVVMLLFVIGLEMRPSRLWTQRRDLLGMGSLQILLTGLVITLYASAGVASWKTALFIGLTMALSSTAFVMQMLQERGELTSKHGNGAFSILLMQDLSVVPLLALVPLLSDTAPIAGASAPLWEQLLILGGMFAVLGVFGLRVVPFALDWLARHHNREAFLLVVLLAVFLAAWAMHQAGTSMALGAFIMGMLLSGSRYNMQVRAHIEPYKGLLMSLFFVAVGMSIDIGEISNRPLEILGHTAALISIKFLVLLPLALLFGYSRGNSVRIATWLAQAGEFGFVLLGSALVLGVVDETTFVTAVGVISLSMLLTPLLVQAGDRLASRLDGRPSASGDTLSSVLETSEPQVLIGGYGRMGHTVATVLQMSEIPFVAFDIDPDRVEQGRLSGHRVLYGDISNLELLSLVRAGRASLVVLTIGHTESALRAVSHLRNFYPGAPIIARARDLDVSSRLLEAGATEAFPEALEASMRLGAKALEMVGTPEDTVDRMMQGVREQGYELVSEESESYNS